MENDLVGVGIEPTYRVFQTRANPSQLSDPNYFRFKIEDFRLLLPDYRLNLKSEICNLKSTSCLFAHNLFANVSVIMHVHEEVFAPLGTILCIVTKHDLLQLHS